MPPLNFSSDSWQGTPPTNFWPTPDDQRQSILVGTPGLSVWCSTGYVGEVRGMKVASDTLYAVVGRDVLSISQLAAVTWLGQVGTTTGKCWIEYQKTALGYQIGICDGESLYTYTTNTATFAQVTDADFPGASCFTSQDTYGIVIKPGTREFYVSDALDFSSWDALWYASKEANPDLLVSIISDHRELWLLGSDTCEVWYNSGTDVPPFDRINGAYIEQGCAAAESVAKLDNSVFWLTNLRQVVRAQGYDPVIISTSKLERWLHELDSVSDARAITYVQDGHAIYQLTVGGQTWAYDCRTQVWHRRSSYPDEGRHRAASYAFFANKHLFGDFENGLIYEHDPEVYTDNSQPIIRRVYSTTVQAENQVMFHVKMETEFEGGLGLANGQGSDPQAMLRWSDDAGHTWSSEHWRSAGKIGEYRNRAIWRRLGRSRQRIYEVSVSDPIPWRILGAYVSIEPGTK